MANKLKDIFSDDMFDVNNVLHFKDNEAYKKFLEALDIVQSEGRVVPIEGVTSVTTKFRYQGMQFPFEEHTNISEFYVGPAEEPVQVTIKTGAGEKNITLFRSMTKEKVTLRSEPESMVSFQFTFSPGKNKHTISYNIQFEKAKTIESAADSYATAAALLATIYKYEGREIEEGAEKIASTKLYFLQCEAFFRRLSAVAEELDLSISPASLNDLPPEEQRDIDELYVLLCKKKIVRLNAKLTSTDVSRIAAPQTNKDPSVGDRLKLTFLGHVEFSFLQHTISLHTACLIMNAVVKDVQVKDDDTLTVFYGESDSNPMYIAYSAFKTKEDAEYEADNIFNHAADYENAAVSDVYIKELYSDISY